jgi:HEPN domain-containing protein
MSEEKHRQEALRWWSQALADLKAARASLRSETFNWSCFQAQQAGEKALKACWMAHGEEPWGHSLFKLIDDLRLAEVKQALAGCVEAAKALDKLYIPTRYPNGLPDLTPAEAYTAKEAADALALAESVLRVCARIGGFTGI